MTTNKKVFFEQLLPIIEETIAKGNQFSFCAFGISMIPFIRNGKDIVTLGPIDRNSQKNDVVFYRRKNGQFVLHRIVKVHPDGSCDLCGDNQFRIEKAVTPDQMIAILVRLERNGKNVNLQSALVRTWCFMLPLRRFLLHGIRAITYRMKKLHK